MNTTTLQPLTFTKNYQTAKIRLTSPILRIGGAVSQLNPYEYIQAGGKVYLPNQEALARVLLERGKLQQYIQKIEDKEDIKYLLDSIDENWQNLTDSYDNQVFPAIGISRKWVNGKISDLRPMIRNGFGEPYIPGSSIKGAMRSAIAFFLLKHGEKYNTPKEISQIEAQLRQNLANDRGKKEFKRRQKFADDRLFMSDLFEDFSLGYKDKKYQPRIGPYTDFLRALDISDSTPLLAQTVPNKKTGKRKTYNIPVVTEVIVSSHFHDYNAKYKASLYTEMIFKVCCEFTITLDLEMLSWFNHNQGMKLPFNSIEELVNICQEFSQIQWDGEYDYWNNINDNKDKGKNLDFESIRDFYEEEKCPYQLRLGWGTGMGGTTINWLINDDLRSQIRDTCGLKAPNFQAPKSRRTILNRDSHIRYVPGWTKLNIIN
ncbi:type III-A CRISPR-associated RAMP protein Csm5 [Cyanobacterium aponinum]|uniref:CRISPR system Cms protein Csm5 n=1 Tax=Cyanobacterium aponinum 0216 TaxID=2676140 RepID=A0A844GRE2_9CHRO|nr:type III-A CRISPR-associated RAMP protein Csm5 [Cyanobacterium aponinum]MTF39094.1 type III-A CRISPR-associated RAMP protein Csm5 [Cyanobacterium aponinum 0216]